ncbi:MAG: hypothetical protein H7A53_00855 [Akkermansiaceae bacterium]|nr:hypothetical protein [Akkermansiaceae bacterium]
MAAVTRKDALTFRREPGQWVQFVVVFGLLALYATGPATAQPARTILATSFSSPISAISPYALALSTPDDPVPCFHSSVWRDGAWIAISPLHACAGWSCSSSQPPFHLRRRRARGRHFRKHAGTAAGGCQLFHQRRPVVVSQAERDGRGLPGSFSPISGNPTPPRLSSGFGGTLCLVSSFVFITTILLLLTYARLNF